MLLRRARVIPLPLQQDMSLFEYGNSSMYSDYTLPSLCENPDFVSENPHQRRWSLVKRAGVYGPTISISLGKFSFPPLTDANDGSGGA